MMDTGNQRQHHKIEGLPDPNRPETYSSPPSTPNKRKWSNVLPIFVGLVVIGEIAFLGRLDMVKNADLVNSLAESFYKFTQTSHYWSTDSWVDESGSGSEGSGLQNHQESCQDWLEREDYVPYSRDFRKEPILVHGAAEVCIV